MGFVLISLAIVSIPSIDGVWETGQTGIWRTIAAIYVFASSIALLFTVNPSLARTLAWGFLGAGCFFFVFVSSVWFFWLPVAIGAIVQMFRCSAGWRSDF